MEISVIMSVFNTKEEYLRASIDSILSQTFKEFEFIIVNDGSSRNTVCILESYTDSRICLIHNDENIGLTRSLNRALAAASGKYIARMDADDISYASRLEKQYKYMEQHPETDILGSWCRRGKRIDKCGGKVTNEWRKVWMLFRNHGIVHSTAFIRREFLKRNKLMYDAAMKKAQDYKLWVDCLNRGAKMDVYPGVLVQYRIHAGQISNAQSKEQMYCVRQIREELIKEIYPEINPQELEQFINKNALVLSREELIAFIRNIERRNSERMLYDPKLLHNEFIYYYEKKLGVYYIMRLNYIKYRMQRSLVKMGI